ncbi:aldo/keto reductase [Botrimarina sp.]|uniref:aldo/keto reductase n=1 Tax=Botrimarina sp. TaxID=2795802 RepID=UPI0032EF0D36
MTDFDRRRFIGASAAMGAGAWAASAEGKPTAAASRPSGPTAEPSGAADAPPPPPVVDLGKTGIRTSRLAQGTGVHGGNRQSDQTRMGFADLVGLFQHAYDRGVRFFDLADLYGTHVYFREALRSIPRDEVAILTKVWWPYDGPRSETGVPHRAQDVRSTLERFCHELTTDHLDVVLLHCLTDARWPDKMEPYMQALDEAKQKGQVRAVGCSCHDLGALKTAAVTPWVDVILSRTNPEGVKMDGPPAEVEAVLRQAKANGKAIIGMKIFGEGALADSRERCMAYAQAHDFLDAMTIGFEKPEQIDDVLRLMAKHPAAAA